MASGPLRELLLTIGRQTPAYRAARLNRLSSLPLSHSQVRPPAPAESWRSIGDGLLPRYTNLLEHAMAVTTMAIAISVLPVEGAVALTASLAAAASEIIRRVSRSDQNNPLRKSDEKTPTRSGRADGFQDKM